MTFLSVDQLTQNLPDIAFFAKMRSGKDEAFKIIEELGFNVKRIAFGDIMKEKFYDVFRDIPPEPKPIGEIIHFGQSMREIDIDIWVKYTMGQVRFDRHLMNNHGITPPSLIFTDIRQQNEYDACKQLGCIMVRIDSMEHIRVGRMLKAGERVTEEILTANTETALDSFKPDYVIENNSTHEEFAREILELIYQIQNKR